MKSVAAKGPYDGQKVRELLDSFGDELVQTFHEEVKTLSAERLKEYDQNEIKEMLQNHRASPVFTVTHHDLKTAPTWPSQAKYLGQIDELKVYTNTKGFWKFAPFSVKNNGETQTYA